MPFNRTTAYLCFDPRDPDQRLHDQATWKHTANGILIAATMLHMRRENIPISWDKVAALADLGEDPETLEDAAPARHPITIEQTNAMLRIVMSKRQTDFA